MGDADLGDLLCCAGMMYMCFQMGKSEGRKQENYQGRPTYHAQPGPGMHVGPGAPGYGGGGVYRPGQSYYSAATAGPAPPRTSYYDAAAPYRAPYAVPAPSGQQYAAPPGYPVGPGPNPNNAYQAQQQGGYYPNQGAGATAPSAPSAPSAPAYPPMN